MKKISTSLNLTIFCAFKGSGTTYKEMLYSGRTFSYRVCELIEELLVYQSQDQNKSTNTMHEVTSTR